MKALESNSVPAPFNGQRLLLVDDDSSLLKLLSIRLRHMGLEVKAVESAIEALAVLPVFNPHLVITDLRMDEMNGMALYEQIQQNRPTLPVIIMTAHGTIREAVEATNLGVFGFITKPINHSELNEQIAKSFKVHAGLTSSAIDAKWRKNIIGQSSVMEALLKDVYHVSQSDISVYIQGESGTGKELIAQAIHQASPRKNKPFVAVNCSAIPEELLESELFGHKKGAFSGAIDHRKGLFEQANGGVLFLDEIGDMSPSFQVKLLRALQEGEVRPVGESTTRPIDVRVVSASHRDLKQMVEEKTFRLDLYYRLNIVTLRLPTLTQRPEDIPLLVNHFIGQQNTKVKKISNEAMEILLGYEWPGNIRELKNVIDQACAFATTTLIPASLIENALQKKNLSMPSFSEARKSFERDYLIQLLKLVGGNVSQAARIAKRNRTEFYRLLNRHMLKPASFKNESK
ncbi:Transcriptional response regulatory protein GlrR [hydrothermal vent metagenome]|uniref:Transcriptional response regulatory protein GlrR n=1 Tax=hydrothermal vent metagenome TaxID=652676 RepID=A0A3B0WDX0_9ZZZZ